MNVIVSAVVEDVITDVASSKYVRMQYSLVGHFDYPNRQLLAAVRAALNAALFNFELNFKFQIHVRASERPFPIV